LCQLLRVYWHPRVEANGLETVDGRLQPTTGRREDNPQVGVIGQLLLDRIVGNARADDLAEGRERVGEKCDQSLGV